MSNISMVEAKLPPGFRFHPRDEELVCDYLMKKVSHCDPLLMIEVDLNKCEPWDLPEIACVGGKEWYFYSQRDRKYATGLRTNRATATGYWKATGKDRSILRKGTLVGMRKTLVFYQGRAPKGRKTDWVMHEFRLEGPLGPPKIPPHKEDWVLCRVFYKNKDAVAKPSMGNSCYDDTGSSFPSLMDSYINFDQTQPGLLDLDQYELQVPCFSINVSAAENESHHQFIVNPLIGGGFPHMPQPDPDDNNNINTILIPPKSSSTTTTTTSAFGQVPIGLNATNATPNLDPFSSCDKKAIRAVLDHLTACRNMDNNNSHHPINYVKLGSPSLGDQGSSESYLSHEVGMPNIWNPYL